MRDLRLSEAVTLSSSHGGGSGIKRQYRHILPQPTEIFRYETESVHKCAPFHVFCSSWFYFWLMKPRLQTIYELGSTKNDTSPPPPPHLFICKYQIIKQWDISRKVFVFLSVARNWWHIRVLFSSTFEDGTTPTRKTFNLCIHCASANDALLQIRQGDPLRMIT